jgi:microcystin-dependent protein
MNFTYVLILVVIIIAIIHLYKINNNETFKILSEEQNVGSHNVFINSMEQIIFSTINKNLKTLFDEKANKDSMPDLSVIAYSGVTAPNGWQLCDGANLEYKDGTTNRIVLDNTGNSIKTPDLRGRFVMGSSVASSTASNNKLSTASFKMTTNTDVIAEYDKPDMGMDPTYKNYKVLGSPTISLHQGNLPAHKHEYLKTEFGGFVKGDLPLYGNTNIGISPNSWYPGASGSAGTDESRNQDDFLKPGVPFPILPPFYALVYIIKIR